MQKLARYVATGLLVVGFGLGELASTRTAAAANPFSKMLPKNWSSRKPAPGPQGATSHPTAGGSSASAAIPSPKASVHLPGRMSVADPLSLHYPSKPPQPALYVAMGRVQERMNNFDKAASHYGKALEIDARNRDALLAMAHLHDRQGRLDEAGRVYEEAARYHPADAAVQNDLGLCYARRNRLPQALAGLQRATSLDPSRVLYRNNLATVLAEMGRVDEAHAELARVHGPAVAHYNLGFLLQQRGRKQEAVTQFKRALGLNPDLSGARAWLAKLEGSVPEVAQLPPRNPATRPQSGAPTLEFPNGYGRSGQTAPSAPPPTSGLPQHGPYTPSVTSPGTGDRYGLDPWAPPTNPDPATR